MENQLRACRSRLFGRLRDYLAELRRIGLPAAVLVNGQRAQVDTAGNFQATVQLDGTRTLHIRATDTQGNRRDATFAILRYAP